MSAVTQRRGRGRPKTGGGTVTADTIDRVLSAWNGFDGATTEYGELHHWAVYQDLRAAVTRMARERSGS